MHIFTAVVLFGIAAIVYKFTKPKAWTIIWSGVGVVFASYFIGSWLAYGLYYVSSQKLGIRWSEAKDLIMTFTNGLDSVILMSMIFGAIAVIIIGSNFYRAFRRR